MEQGQTERIVRGLVPTIFAVIHHCHCVGTVRIGYLSPLLSIYFIRCHGIVSSGDRTHSKVIHSFFIENRKREFSLQKSICGLPEDIIHDIYPIIIGSICKADILSEDRVSPLSFHTDCNTQRSFFDNIDFHIFAYSNRLSINSFLKNFPGRPFV